jgi:uncharacterized peroxidase-related enzyme
VSRAALIGHNVDVFIDSVPEQAATGALADYYRVQRDHWGFLPNYTAAFSSRPDIAAIWNQLNATVREGMQRRRFEIATIAAARAFRSTYCAAAHSSFLRDVCNDETTMTAIAADPTGATLEDQDGAVYRFATKLARDASSIDQNDVDAVRAAGLSDSEIADVVFTVAARAFFTTVLDGLGARLDDEIATTFAPDVLSSLTVGRPPAPRTDS